VDQQWKTNKNAAELDRKAVDTKLRDKRCNRIHNTLESERIKRRDIESLAVSSSSDSIWWRDVVEVDNFIFRVFTGLRML
jgi:hypothetical protein